MAEPAWYLLAYDIREPRRLKRVHRSLRSEGVPMQRSVFFVRARPRDIKRILDAVEKLIHRRQDDVRVYPIGHPSRVWLHGYNAFGAAPETAPARGARLLGGLKNLLRIGHG